MDADVLDLFYLPFDDAGGGDTTVIALDRRPDLDAEPDADLDANGGSNMMTHQSQGPDYGTNYGLDMFGIPG